MPIVRQSKRSPRQAGYSLLMVVFMVATIILFASIAAPNLLTQGRRERESETVWRGEQYQRAIGLYFKKIGRYPTKIDDLTKETNGVRFLRKAYTDPNNKEDGSWRFIYVGPNGQLIGSLMHTSLLQTVVSTPTPPGGSILGGLLGIGSGQPATGTPAGTGTASGPGQTGSQPGQQSNGASTPNPLESQPQPLDGVVIGGNIAGVASKIKEPSFRIYKGGDTYQKWEFIVIQQQAAIPGQLPVNPNAPAGTGANGVQGVPGGPGTQPPTQQPTQQPPDQSTQPPPPTAPQ